MSTAIQNHADCVIDGHNSIENCVLEVVSRIDDLQAAFTEMQEQAQSNTIAIEAMHSTLKNLTLSPPPHAHHTQSSNANANANSYAARTRIPAVYNKVMARTEEQTQQVLFTKAQGMASQGLDRQDPHILITKANLALSVMKTSHNDTPKGIQFMSAKTLAKGDILFDMDSSESEKWLRKGGIQMEFMQGFGEMSEIKDREHSCIVENVPVDFHPSAESSLGVETTNGLAPNSILLAQWIKPIERCYEGQRTAFMFFTFRTAKDANKAIHNNLYIHGKRCATRKLLPKLHRCFKCHAINAWHIAANRKEIADICDTCGSAHLSKECRLKDKDPKKHFCINCKVHEHATHDWLCPAYLKESNELNNKMPENMYKYFPTNNPNTWVLVNSTEDNLHQPSQNDEWTHVTSKRKKQYHYPSPSTQTESRTNKTPAATNANTEPLGKQHFLNDMGIASSSWPRPSQQYQTPSQRQRAEDHHAMQPSPLQSRFSPISTEPQTT